MESVGFEPTSQDCASRFDPGRYRIDPVRGWFERSLPKGFEGRAAPFRAHQYWPDATNH